MKKVSFISCNTIFHMGNIVKNTVFLLIFMNALRVSAQTLTIVPIPYSVSIPPKDINVYTLSSTTAFASGCNFDWEVTNGWIQYIGGQSTKTVSYDAGGYVQNIYFKNENGNGKVKITVKDCTGGAAANNGKSSEHTIAIRYLGAVGDIKINGSPVGSSASVSCGSFTASVDAVTNATGYVWELPSGWSGSSSTNSINVTTSGSTGGNLKVTAKRSDAPDFNDQNKTTNLSINNFPSTPSISFSGSPSSTHLCASESATLTASASNATSYNWTATGSARVNGSTSATGSSVTLTGAGNGPGTYSVKSYSSACGAESNNAASAQIHLGLPTYSSMLANGSPFYGNMCNGASIYFTALNEGATSYNWEITSGNGSNAYLTGYSNGTAYFNSYVNDCYGIDIDFTNRCGTYSDGITVCVDNCFARYAVYPNPVTNQISIELGETKNKKTLPQRVDLFEEKSTKKMRTVDVRDAFEKKSLKADGILTINVEDLPRGVYYLHITNNETAGDKLVVQRVVLN
ncbi:T9SS type A sorting domain-containing protein [Runella zeae]|uniref:T9SS type A sorting domain-containing protein n=1 Tax=Runella zeae TaxID=94255 RepID=UPI00235452A2|nr:T9SS type A sorting domain-containing protein [Runella zeae]